MHVSGVAGLIAASMKCAGAAADGQSSLQPLCQELSTAGALLAGACHALPCDVALAGVGFHEASRPTKPDDVFDDWCPSRS